MRSDANAMTTKGNVVLYLDKELVNKSKELGFNLSKTFENHLKHLITQFSTSNSVKNFDSTSKKGKWWAEPDLNRRPLARKGAFSEIDWADFKQWLSHRYAKSNTPSILSYCKRYNHIIQGNIKEIDLLLPKSKNSIVKALIVLSKYLGIHQDFKKDLKNYGVKLFSPDAFSSFMRVYTNSNSDIDKWVAKACEVLRPNERTYLQFMSITGLRKQEGIIAFNKIIELNKTNNLKEYFNEEKGLLEHFKYKEQFLRRTKNVYISIIPKEILLEIAECEPVSYNALRKRLMKYTIRVRINELRDHFGTFMIRHGLIKEEVDLLQGRIPPSIFIRHYWSPSFSELKDRTLKGIELLKSNSNTNLKHF
jgi:intergrase/recombinase